MESNRLRHFKTVVDTGGLIRASEILGISGGGLSKSLKALEAELGYKVLAQKGRGLELTEEGRALYERVHAVLEMVEGLQNLKTMTPSKQASILRLVSFEVFTSHFAADLIAESFADFSIEIREALPGMMEAYVADGHSDFGITYQPVPHAGVEFVKCGRIRMGIFGLKDSWSKTPVADLPFVTPAPPVHGMPSGVRGLDGWPEHLFERKIRYRVEMMESAIQICKRGLAVAFIPAFVGDLINKGSDAKNQLREIPLPSEVESVERDVFLIRRRGSEENKSTRLLARSIRKLR